MAEETARPNQAAKATAFRALHEKPGLFVLPNPWDAGTARILAGLGYPALATTSAGCAFGLGRRDGGGRVSRAEALDNARLIVAATDLPVAGDLENGYGDTPEACAETIRAAAAAGLVGGSIEDATGRDADPIYPIEQAAERVAAAAEAARALPFDFMLAGRPENYLHGRRDLDDTIRRLQAYERAGADVLYAPGLTDLEEIRAVCAAVTKPVNVLGGIGPHPLPLAELEAAGVKRVSLGSVFLNATIGAFLRAAREVREQGTFCFSEEAATAADFKGFL
ncbi:MAG: isocitrate lyase/phosphoenolpyruvate mutase family protein [Azospirillaceae bacterium]